MATMLVAPNSPGAPVEAKPSPALAALTDKDALKRTPEVQAAVLKHPSRRTHADLNKISALLTSMPGTSYLSVVAMNQLAHCVQGIKYGSGEEVYIVGEFADAYFIVMMGQVTMFDSREKDDTETGSDPAIKVINANDGFGEEELLSGGRRAYSATCSMRDTILLRVRLDDYKRIVESQHTGAFDNKVEFLSTLSPFRALTSNAVRSIAPAFHEVQIAKGDWLVRQGERADCMYAIKVGSVSVYVDPHYKEGNGLADLDPKKIMQVCMQGVGSIIGDMTVLANAKTRTASVMAATDVVAYRVRKGLFLRRVPNDLLEIMRRVAVDKLRLKTKQVHVQPVVQSLKDKILHGHNLRELMGQIDARQAAVPSKDAQEYSKLISLLRQQKRGGDGASANGKTRPRSSPFPGAPDTTNRTRSISSLGTRSHEGDDESALDDRRLLSSLSDAGVASTSGRLAAAGDLRASADIASVLGGQRGESAASHETAAHHQQQQRVKHIPGFRPASGPHTSSIKGRIAAVYSTNTVSYWTYEARGTRPGTAPASTCTTNNTTSHRQQASGSNSLLLPDATATPQPATTSPYWTPPTIPRTGSHYQAPPYTSPQAAGATPGNARSPSPWPFVVQTSPSYSKGLPITAALNAAAAAAAGGPVSSGVGVGGHPPTSSAIMLARCVSPTSTHVPASASAAATEAAAAAGGRQSAAEPRAWDAGPRLPKASSPTGSLLPAPPLLVAADSAAEGSQSALFSRSGATPAGPSHVYVSDSAPADGVCGDLGSGGREGGGGSGAGGGFGGGGGLESPERSKLRFGAPAGRSDAWAADRAASPTSPDGPSAAARQSLMGSVTWSTGQLSVMSRLAVESTPKYSVTHAGSTRGAATPREQRDIDELLTAMSQPLMENRFGHMRKSTAHFRPKIPKTTFLY